MRRTLCIVMFTLLAVGLFADAAQTLQFGMKLYSDGLYDEAVRAFEDVLAQSPASPEAEEALFHIGESWRKRGDYIRAGVYYRRLLDGFPSSSRREEALRRWGEALVEQGSFVEATAPFEELVERYPQSQHTRASLAALAHVWFETGQYRRVVNTVEEWQKNYQGHAGLPEAVYWEAEALIGSGLEAEGRTLLERLASEQRDHDAGWRAVRRLARLIERDQDETAAADWLRAQVWSPSQPGRPAEGLPRLLAEELAGLLLRYDRKLERWGDMRVDAMYLFDTFSRSERFESYYIAVLEALLGLQRYAEIARFEERHPHEFRDETMAQQRDLIVADGMLATGRVEQALSRGELLMELAASDSLRAQAILLTANAHEALGRKRDALNAYRQLLSRYPAWVDAVRLNLHVGDLYAGAFARPDMAIPYYRQCVGGAVDADLAARGRTALAEAYESLGRYADARLELSQIPMFTLRDDELARRIKQKRYRLHRFYGGDSNAAVAGLAAAMSDFAAHGSQARLQGDLADALRQAGRFEDALALVPADATPDTDLTRALLLIDLTEKARYEGRDDSVYRQALAAIRTRYAADTAVAREIDLNMQLRIESDYAVGADLSGRIETLLAASPDAATGNLLHLAAADGWLTQSDSARALPHLQAFAADALVPPGEYRRGKRLLGDIHFHRGEMTAARDAYALAQVDLFNSGAEAVYRYARAQQAAGAAAEALTTMSFLLDNGEPFPALAQAVAFTVEGWRVQGRYNRALRYLRLTPENMRDADYWTAMADIHVALDQPGQAREALASIKEKSAATLYKLAELQMQTGGYDEAAESFTELEKQDAANSTRYRVRRAQALFATGDYAAALEAFDAVIPKLTPDPARYVGFDLRETVIEATIAAYEAGNRPKAESTRKQFKSLLEDDAVAIARLDLHEGIYYTRMDAGKAAKLLGKLAEDETAPLDIREQATFWRGVAYINDKKSGKAEEAFSQLVAQTTDERLLAQARLKLGTLAFTGEQYERALEQYAWVIEHDDQGDLARDALQNYAVACKRMQSWDRAVAAYELMLQRRDKSEVDAKTRFDVAYCYYRDGKYNLSAAMFEEVLPMLDNAEMKAEAQFWIGASRFEQEDYDAAVNEYLKVSYNYPDLAQWAATAELKAADAYIRLGKTDRARTLLERVVAKYGRNSDWGGEAAKALDRL